MGFKGEIPTGIVALSTVHTGLQGVALGQLGSVPSGVDVLTHDTGIAAWPLVEHVAGSTAKGSGQSVGQAQELSK